MANQNFKVKTGLEVGTGVTISAGIVTASTFSGNATNATYAVTAGVSTYSGVSGFSTFSGYSNASGISTFSGYSDTTGFSTFSGYANNTGIATYAITAGVSTYSGVSGFSTFSGYSNASGVSTFSGYSNNAGIATSVIAGIASVTQLQVSGVSTLTGSVSIGTSAIFGSNVKIYMGSNDPILGQLQIYNDGLTSYIRHLSTISGLDINSDQPITIKGLGTNCAIFNPALSVELYYNNSKKFETTGYGATVYGVFQSQGLQVSGVATATTFSGSGASLTSLNASNLSSGTVPTARLASGTADSTTYLRGDQTWASISGGATLSNDTTTNATYYPTFSSTTSGTYSTAYVSNTKCTFNPSTGTLSATVFTSLSDRTQKTDITPITDAIETVKQLQGVKYKWIDNHNKESIGVIAQDIEKVLPEVVNQNPDGLKSVSYGNIVGLLIEAIKEQQVRIEELERKLNA